MTAAIGNPRGTTSTIPRWDSGINAWRLWKYDETRDERKTENYRLSTDSSNRRKPLRRIGASEN